MRLLFHPFRPSVNLAIRQVALDRSLNNPYGWLLNNHPLPYDAVSVANSAARRCRDLLLTLQIMSNDEPPTSIDPDDAEEVLADEIDNIIPTRGYQMAPMVGLGGSAGSIPALQAF